MKHLLTALAIIFTVILAATAATRSPKQEITRNLDIFTSIYKTLQTTYVDTIDTDRSMTTAIMAMLDDIDPYTEYIPEKDRDDFITIASGEYGGIGSYIVTRGDTTLISEPHIGSPAARAGLRPGDRILAIDGVKATGLPGDSVSRRLKGQAGTPLTVTVRRPYATPDSILDITLTRAKIEIDPVPFAGIIRDSIGYIHLNTFNEKAAERVRDELQKLMADPRLSGLVLDLRGNGGGLLDEAVKILGLFLPKGTEVLRTRGKGLLNEKIYKTSTTPLAPDLRLAVLVNQGSASASEIVTGALQDLDRAVIVGQRTFGKGLVQSTRQIPYNGLLKVTIAKYYIPSGRLIQAIDYSHRNPDGSVARIPDSLTTVYHTAAGREVRDGGGITPDITVTYPDANRLTYTLVSDFWTFDYATRYAATHPVIPEPGEFTVTDEIYDDFKRFINPDSIHYDRVCETILDNLEKAARTEGYLSDTVTAQLDALRTTLRHDLSHDLDTHRDQIAPYLESEIVSRYYYEPGSIRQSLTNGSDLDMKAAADILADPANYRLRLSPEYNRHD